MEIEKSRAEMMRDMDSELEDRLGHARHQIEETQEKASNSFADAVQKFRTRIEEKENEFSSKIELNIARFFDMKKSLEGTQESLIEICNPKSAASKTRSVRPMTSS
jgi:Skp family chaperone for outer membrane proteins